MTKFAPKNKLVMTVKTIIGACVLLAMAVALLAIGLITGRDKQALRRHGCHHKNLNND